MFNNNNGGSMGPADFAALLGGNAMNGLGGEGGLLILIILFALFGWGGNGNGFGNGGGRGSYPVYVGGAGAGSVGGDALYPWLNQSQSMQQGFTGIATQLCDGFAGVQMSLANGFAGVESGANNRQMANMQQGFAMQTALLQGFNSLGSQLADCCCENRLATANQTATILAEHCADRNALQMGIRDVIDNDNRIGQSIMDKLCQLELDGVKGQLAQAQRENVGLQNQLNLATQDAKFTALGASMQTGFANEVDALYNRLNSCPVPTTPVFGRTPIFTCGGQNPGCQCNGQNPGCQCNGQQVLFG